MKEITNPPESMDASTSFLYSSLLAKQQQLHTENLDYQQKIQLLTEENRWLKE